MDPLPVVAVESLPAVLFESATTSPIDLAPTAGFTMKTTGAWASTMIGSKSCQP
jgi:hypothetical protein